MTEHRSFPYRVSEVLAILCWSLLYLLRNRRQGWLTRDEIRSARFSFSQFGEDLVIEDLLNQMGISRGFYVDVGAFDPVIGSNTLLLFKRGWSGINIDVDEQKMTRFRRARPRDWNLACGVSKSAGRKQFARYTAASMTRMITGTDDRSILGEPPVETFEVDTKPLQAILEDSSFRGRQIDFLNIDCEGNDLEVLESLDFAAYQPRLLAVETIDASAEAKISQFLNGHGYGMTHRLGFTRIFIPRTEVARPGFDG
jgi:FkbM family methyltransferase